MNNIITVPKVLDVDLDLRYDVLEHTFSKIQSNNIAHSPWEKDFPYKPEVSFKIIHSASFIALYYHVNEEFVRATAMRANENVWEDSCVEFFLSMDNKETYYNFEFNVLGTGLIGYGTAVKADRKRLSAAEIDRVDVLTQIVKKDAIKSWHTFVIIPKDIISSENISGKTCHANFYKCGDNLPNPHFMSWNHIDNPSPNFHLPQFFGELIFE